jgi:GGDEF domain-containing protein
LEAIVERLRKSVAAYNAARDGPALRLSVGGATAEKGERLVEALKRADERMYRDKKRGKR